MSTPKYWEGHESCGLKVGDTVEILRLPTSEERCDWDHWPSNMDSTVGMIGVIRDLNNTGFRVVITCKTGLIQWNYPYFVLAKIGNL